MPLKPIIKFIGVDRWGDEIVGWRNICEGGRVSWHKQVSSVTHVNRTAWLRQSHFICDIYLTHAILPSYSTNGGESGIFRRVEWAVG